MWERFKECFGDGVICLFGAITFVMFLLIILYGSVLVFEDIKIVLWLELVIIAPGAMALGIERLIKDLKRKRR